MDESLRTEKTLTLRTAWTIKDAKYIQQWLETKNFDHLADLLRLRPHNMSNPLVFFQIFHLSNLLHWGACDEEDRSYSPLVEGQVEPLSYETKLMAKTALHQLFSAWVSTMLPGYMVQPVKRPAKRGPRHKVDSYEMQVLLHDFNELMQLLKGIKDEDLSSLSAKMRETDRAFCKRMSAMVQRIHLESLQSLFTHKYHREPPEDQWDDETIGKRYTLKRQIAESIASKSIGKTKKVLPRKLVYELMTVHHPYLQSARKVRRFIERAEDDFPEHFVFRPGVFES